MGEATKQVFTGVAGAQSVSPRSHAFIAVNNLKSLQGTFFIFLYF